MKKIGLLFILFVMLFTVTGCLKDRREVLEEKNNDIILEKKVKK